MSDYEIDVLEETQHLTHKSVRVTAPAGLEDSSYPFIVRVYSYGSDPKEAPRMRVDSGPVASDATRKQWELLKRLADAAWDEYERRFPL